LLQLVVETITNQPLEKLMQERVFLPFAMTRSNMIWRQDFEENFANGYDEYGRSLGPQKRPKADAAGSLLTTPHDFALFLQAVMGSQGLSQQMHEQMLTPQISISSKNGFPPFENETTEENKAIRLSYGLAWGLYWTPYGEAFFKEGHDVSWMNYTVCFNKSGTGILIMTNSGNGEGIYKPLLEALLRNTFTPIEWEGFTPYNELPPRPSLKRPNLCRRPVADTLVFIDDVETRLLLVRPQNVHIMVLTAILDSSLILHFHFAALMPRNLVNGFFIYPN
jgi:CubicO group peptidase (beta-lactamase class C family)